MEGVQQGRKGRAVRAESGGGVFGQGAASPLPTSEGSGQRYKLAQRGPGALPSGLPHDGVSCCILGAFCTANGGGGSAPNPPSARHCIWTCQVTGCCHTEKMADCSSSSHICIKTSGKRNWTLNINPLKGRAVKCYILPSRSNVHF